MLFGEYEGIRQVFGEKYRGKKNEKGMFWNLNNLLKKINIIGFGN